MKAIMIMYDTLIRKYLPCYGGEAIMPNFERLAQQSTTFDNCYVGSMPCMPARRELHTGRYNFLHRSWGPLEPFDDSMPEILKRRGIHSHLVSDHQHYWEDGGATYHTRYSTWDCVRGQEGDPWKVNLDPAIQGTAGFGGFYSPELVNTMHRQDAVNRLYTQAEEDHPQAVTFRGGLEFLQTNHNYDNWFLQMETFDPHEPFFSTPEFEALYPPVDYEGPDVDWPPYAPCEESPDVIAHIQRKYKALMSMCDKNLGRILDAMDAYDLWKDTLLIVNTDHGYLLGEHQWWSKSIMPLYDEICHTPLFIWDPRCGRKGGRNGALVQTIDLAPTLLDFFGLPIPPDMQGVPLGRTLAEDCPVRDYALFGYHGGSVNITDGTYVYMRGPQCLENRPLYEYTLMPTHMRAPFSLDELATAEMHPAFTFTKGCPVMKITPSAQNQQFGSWFRYGSKLYKLNEDPQQQRPLEDAEREADMLNHMAALLRQNDAPPEQYQRLGIDLEYEATEDSILRQRGNAPRLHLPPLLERFVWDWIAAEQYGVLQSILPDRQQLEQSIFQALTQDPPERVDAGWMLNYAEKYLAKQHPFLPPLLRMTARTN